MPKTFFECCMSHFTFRKNVLSGPMTILEDNRNKMISTTYVRPNNPACYKHHHNRR